MWLHPREAHESVHGRLLGGGAQGVPLGAREGGIGLKGGGKVQALERFSVGCFFGIVPSLEQLSFSYP